MRAVAKWKELAEIYSTKENVQKAIQMLDAVEQVLMASGADVSTMRKVKGPTNRPKQSTFSLPLYVWFILTETTALIKLNISQFKGLATEEDIKDLLLIYQRYFDEYNDENQQPVLSSSSTSSSLQLHDVDSSDLGSEVEAQLSFKRLARNLGFVQNQLPHQYNTHRHIAGFTAWDDPTHFEDSQSDSLSSLKLHWHQLSGVHSIVRRAFTATADSSHCTGTLECDEVGLGKTTLTLAVIAFLNQVIALQKDDASLPPILRQFDQFFSYIFFHSSAFR